MIMSASPYNSQPPISAINFRTVPGLVHICKLMGKDSAVPRIMHKHKNRVEVVFIVQGGGNYSIGEHTYVANQGDILIFNNNVVHDERNLTSESALIYSLGIEPLTWNSALEKYKIPIKTPSCIHSGDDYELLLEYFNLLWTSESVDYVNSHGAFSELIELIAITTRKACFDLTSHVGSSLGGKILNHIEDNFLNEISLETIAEKLEISVFYLIHVFKKHTGHSPKQYIIRRRIGEAQSLLVSGRHNITEVANCVGYFNISNFNRIFKQITGMAPGDYQKYLKRCVISRRGFPIDIQD